MVNDVQQADLIVSIVFAVASLCIVTLRLWDRRCLRKLSLATDDYAILLSLLFVIVWTVTTIVWVARYGLGQSTPLPDDELAPWGKLYYANRLFYCCGFNLAKVAIILFYMKLTDRLTQSKYWKFLVGFLTFECFVFLLHFLLLAVPCTPVETFWTNGLAPVSSSKCLEPATAAVVINSFTFISEAVIVLAPIPLLWLSGITGRQRIGLGLMFSLGVLLIVASALKLRSVIKSTQQAPTYETGIAWIWLSIEMNVAVLVAGFLPLKALFEANFRRVKRRFSAPNTSLSSSDDAADSARRKSSPDVEAALAVDHMVYQPESPYSKTTAEEMHKNHDEKTGDV